MSKQWWDGAYSQRTGDYGLGKSMSKQWWDGAYNQRTGDYDLGKSMSKTSKKNGEKQGYAVAWDGRDFDSWMAQGQSNRMQSVTDQGSFETDEPVNAGYRKQQEMLKQAGIDKNLAYHLAHAAGITNVNSKGDIKAIIRAHDQSQVSHPEMETYMAKNKGNKKKNKNNDDDKPLEPEVPELSDKDKQIQENYNNGYYDIPQRSYGETWMAQHAANQANQALAWAKKSDALYDKSRYGQGGNSSFDTKYSTTAKASTGLGLQFAGSRRFRDDLMSHFA